MMSLCTCLAEPPERGSWRNIKGWLIHAMVLFMGTTLAWAAPAQDDVFYIFKDGQPQAAIILPASAKAASTATFNDLTLQVVPAGVPSNLARAAQEFQADILDGYGIRIPEGENSGLPNRIMLEVVQTSLMQEDHTEVSFPNPKVMLIRGGESGVMRALFHILEKFGGVRYLFQDNSTAGNLGTHFPPRTSLGIPRQPFSHDSAFPLGRRSNQTIYGIGWEGTANRKHYWAWEMRLGAKARIADRHSLTHFIFPIEKCIKADQKPADDIFPVHQGQRVLPYEWKVDLSKPMSSRIYRHGWQPRYSGQATVDEAIKNILVHLKEHPQTQSISLSVNDNRGHSDDEAGRESEAYWDWVNKVAQGVTQTYPHMMFGAYAYSKVQAPPSFRIHPNVVVYITFDWHGVIHPDVRRERVELVRRWSQLANIGPYSYDYGESFYSLPRLYMQEMQEMAKLFHESGAVASISERSHNVMVEGPKIYVYYKLMENPDLDMEATMQDWFEAAVGPKAAVYLRQYYAFWEDFWQTKATRTTWWQSGRHATYLGLGHFGSYIYGLEPGDMNHCRDLMEKMVESAAADSLPDQARRAKLLMNIFKWHEANAIATGAEILSVDGTIADSQAAIRLLRNMPAAQKAFELTMALPTQSPKWLASEAVVNSLSRATPLPTTLSAVSRHLSDPAVIEELDRLARNPELNPELRFLAGMMSHSGKGDVTENILDNSGFEKPDLAWIVTNPIHGKAAISSEVAYQGSHSLKCEINYANFIISASLPRNTPGVQYFFSAMVFVPSNQPTEERRLNISGSAMMRRGDKFANLNHTRNIPDIVLIPGQWNYVSCVIPGDAKTEAIGARLRLKNFEPGEVLYIDDVKLTPIVE